MKKALVIVGICLVAGYLIFAALYFEENPQEGSCTKFDIEIANRKKDLNYIETDGLKKYITGKALNPEGKRLKDIKLSAIETALATNPYVKKVEVYTTGSGTIKASITQRIPILRVIPASGESYYVDEEGKKMPLSKSFTAYLPIVSGSVKESYATGSLYKLALFLHDNEFWNAQIEQIVIMPNDDLKLIPRVGDHQIILGKLEGYEEKLDKLMVFYKNGLNEMGWNKYSVLNLKYDKQVIATRR